MVFDLVLFTRTTILLGVSVTLLICLIVVIGMTVEETHQPVQTHFTVIEIVYP